jgi:hypothetical protein
VVVEASVFLRALDLVIPAAIVAKLLRMRIVPRKPSGYWRIEIMQREETIFRQRLPGNLSTKKIGNILQRLVCTKLSPIEIVSASTGSNTLLEVRVDGLPHGKRTMVWIPSHSDYLASYCKADEPALPDMD